MQPMPHQRPERPSLPRPVHAVSNPFAPSLCELGALSKARRSARRAHNALPADSRASRKEAPWN